MSDRGTNSIIRRASHRRDWRARSPLAVAVALLLVLSSTTPAALADQATDYTEFSLEALTNLEIVSVSKRPESMNDAAAAIYVITADAIRRSGATSVPELFRMVPGVQVARIDADKWAVTARGFNGRYANKLLVLVDGRSAYEPAFSGVFWESIGVSLIDIERIEVIRGPGATLWGANAMNGVINIITKHAGDTTGLRASIGAGNEEKLLSSLRVGGMLAEDLAVRATFEYADRDDFVDKMGQDAGDGRDLIRASGRLDWQPGERDHVMATGSYYDSSSPSVYWRASLTPPYGERQESPFETRNESALARWTHRFENGSSFEFQSFFTGVTVTDTLAILDEEILDLELRHSWRPADDHDVVWGGGYRVTWDDFGVGMANFEPATKRTELGNAFLQDTWTLLPDRLRLVVGAKFEMFSEQSSELLPNLRLAWTPTATQTVWGAVSRAVRTPSRYERSVAIGITAVPAGAPGNPTSLPVLVEVRGRTDLPPENLTAYELGYRFMPTATTSCDLALFYHQYEDLRSLTMGEVETVMAGIPHLVQPLYFDSEIEGDTWGAEFMAEWKVRDHWRLQSALTLFDEDPALSNDDPAITGSYGQTISPHLQWTLGSSADLTESLVCDLMLRHVAEVEIIGVDATWFLDASLGWRPAQNLELSLTGRNLLEPETLEFSDEALQGRAALVQRSVYGKVAVWF